jgi:hypothetical protein
MHEGLKAERYVGGVTLIPAKMKPKIVANNGAIVDGPEQLVFTPYVKVETRVAYFWDLMAQHPEWVGASRRSRPSGSRRRAMTNVHLPPGFFRMPVQKADGKHVEYIGQSVRVRVYKADTLEWAESWASGKREQVLRGIPVMAPPPGTKVVPVLNKWGEDPFALMKAETGALGRALGMAGMLVVPGSGVATAEDVQEAMERPGGVGANLPGDPSDFAEQAGGAAAAQRRRASRTRAEELIAQLGGAPGRARRGPGVGEGAQAQPRRAHRGVARAPRRRQEARGSRRCRSVSSASRRGWSRPPTTRTSSRSLRLRARGLEVLVDVRAGGTQVDLVVGRARPVPRRGQGDVAAVHRPAQLPVRVAADRHDRARTTRSPEAAPPTC